MGILKLNPIGLNTVAHPANTQPGEADVVSNVDLESKPGSILKRGGTSLWGDAGAGIVNAECVTMGNGDVYLMIKTSGTGITSVLYRKLYTASTGSGTLGTITAWPAPTGWTPSWTAAAGSFVAMNGNCYYFNPGAIGLYFDGSTTHNVGLGTPTGTWGATATGDGQLTGVYLWMVTAYDSARNVESNATDVFPVTSYNDIGLELTTATKTLATIAKGTAALANGDAATHLCLWRSCDQVLAYTDENRNIYAPYVPFYRVLSAPWTTTGVYDGYHDFSLHRGETAPYTDNCRPPACSFAEFHRNRLVCLTAGGDLYWSQYSRPEQFPYQNSWSSTVAGALWRDLKGRVENRSRSNNVDGPVVAMAPAGGRLMVFTATGTYAVEGGEGKIIDRVDVPHGCVAQLAAAQVPGSSLFVLSKNGLIGWPGGVDLSYGRFSAIVTAANATYLNKAAVGYSGYDQTVLAAVPNGSATKSNLVYVYGLRSRRVSTWSFGWADGTTRGISAIVNVDLPNARPYTLFCCDDGKIYKYPDTNQDAGVSFTSQYRCFIGQDSATRIKKDTDLTVVCGALTGTVNVTLRPMNHTSDSVTIAESALGATQSSTTQVLVDQTGGSFGRFKQIDISAPAENATWEIAGLYVEDERDDPS